MIYNSEQLILINEFLIMEVELTENSHIDSGRRFNIINFSCTSVRAGVINSSGFRQNVGTHEDILGIRAENRRKQDLKLLEGILEGILEVTFDGLNKVT